MTRGLILAVAFAASFLAGGALEAQILSPGRLATAHEELEGVRQCTACHELGTRGIAPDRCLDCHLPLADRIEAGLGYHATITDRNCAECHQDHLGRDFDLLHFDPETFEHDDAGYALELSHAGVECRQCHQPDFIDDAGVTAFKTEHGALTRTYLGLSPSCSTCHSAEDPHGDQFDERTCVDCHDEGDWNEPSRFDHGTTDYPLTGQHTSVRCADCHQSGSDALYRPISSGTCADCHADPHAGAMARACATCHSTEGWAFLAEGALDESFDHGRTGFDLLGAHATADCSSCHVSGRPPRSALLHMTYVAGTAGRSYPTPVAESCSSCHVDRHVVADQDGRWIGCTDCHNEGRWAPSSFGLDRHGSASTFPLTGAHVTTPCFLCHVDTDGPDERFVLALGDTACVSCHVDDDPHENEYGDTTCDACHVTDDFTDVRYTHPESNLLGRSCRSCHDDENPHAGQFADRDCSTCHVTDGYMIPDFDHGGTRFALDGAHAPLECATCHVQEIEEAVTFVRYRPIGTECADCHGGVR